MYGNEELPGMPEYDVMEVSNYVAAIWSAALNVSVRAFL